MIFQYGKLNKFMKVLLNTVLQAPYCLQVSIWRLDLLLNNIYILHLSVSIIDFYGWLEANI